MSSTAKVIFQAIVGILALVFISASPAGAATKKKNKTVVAKQSAVGKGKKSSPSLSRDVVFDGSTINGRYHSAGEAVTTVETEKKMNELVGFRRDFKDRLAVERNRLKSGAAVESSVR